MLLNFGNVVGDIIDHMHVQIIWAHLELFSKGLKEKFNIVTGRKRFITTAFVLPEDAWTG